MRRANLTLEGFLFILFHFEVMLSDLGDCSLGHQFVEWNGNVFEYSINENTVCYYCYLNKTCNHAVYDHALQKMYHSTCHLICSHDQTIVC